MSHIGLGSSPFSKPAFVIITGASGGYGQELAKSILPQLQQSSVLVLTGRDQKRLNELLQRIEVDSPNDMVKITTVVSDLGIIKDVESFVMKCTQEIDINKFNSAILIHNAGILGDVTLKIHQYSDRTAISDYMNISVSNVLFQTAEFLKIFSPWHGTCYIVNVSSLCALEPFNGCGLYCTGKAARDMMFKVLASERLDVRVLNWAPGPMPTQMRFELFKCCDKKVAESCQTMHSDQSHVKCCDSAQKLLKLLIKNEFTSGVHIDYYDV